MNRFKRFPHQIYLDSLFLIPRLDESYNCFSPGDNLRAVIGYCQKEQLTDSIFPSEISLEINNYFKKRKHGVSFVVEDKSKVFTYRDIMKGTVTVKSRKGREQLEHEVRVWNLPAKWIDEEKAYKLFNGMVLRCPCPISRKTCGLVILLENRKVYNDYRKANDVPPPVASEVWCEHSMTTANWLAEKMYFKDFTNFGLTHHNIETIESNIEKILSEEAISRINIHFRDETEYLNPWRKWLGSPLVVKPPHHES